MEYLDHIKTVFLRPALLRRHEHIFLLSHMRANTSLLGHILGSNPEISGYYELHIGYYSKRSLLRQKLLYYKGHQLKPDGRFIFDKVLHDFHYVDMRLLNDIDAYVLFSLREPLQTVKSTVSMFRRKRPGHEFCDLDNAIEYYCSRVASLKKMADECNRFYYFGADDLRSDSDDTLEKISRWLGLKEALSPEFDNFRFSGGGTSAGDLSGNLATRKVIRKPTDYSDILISDADTRRLSAVYAQGQEFLKSHPANMA